MADYYTIDGGRYTKALALAAEKAGRNPRLPGVREDPKVWEIVTDLLEEFLDARGRFAPAPSGKIPTAVLWDPDAREELTESGMEGLVSWPPDFSLGRARSGVPRPSELWGRSLRSFEPQWISAAHFEIAYDYRLNANWARRGFSELFIPIVPAEAEGGHELGARTIQGAPDQPGSHAEGSTAGEKKPTTAGNPKAEQAPPPPVKQTIWTPERLAELAAAIEANMPSPRRSGSVSAAIRTTAKQPPWHEFSFANLKTRYYEGKRASKKK